MIVNTEIEQLERKVIAWAHARNLIEGTTAQHQLVKLMEEIGELSGAILRDDRDATVDGIGDAIVVLINIAEKLELGGIGRCLAKAYLEIKDRKGAMVNGTFVKEVDLPGMGNRV